MKKRVDTTKLQNCDNPKLPQLPNPFPVIWAPHPPNNPPHWQYLMGGQDNDPHQGQKYDLYVCEAPVEVKATGKYVATIPGKLLNDGCNIAVLGAGIVAKEYFIATVNGAFGYWAPPPSRAADWLKVLSGGPGLDGKPLYVCQARYTTQDPDVSFSTFFGTVSLGGHVNDHGVHIGWYSKGMCHFEWGGAEHASGDGVGVYFMSSRPPPNSGTGGTPQKPKPPGALYIASCQVVPASIHLGESARLSARLSRAPTSAMNLAVSIVAPDGSLDTLSRRPISIPFAPGQKQAFVELQTQQTILPAPRIQFHLTQGTNSCGTELTINP